MPGNEDCNCSELELVSLEALPSRRRTGSAQATRLSGRQKSDQEESGDGLSANMDTTPPPLGVKLTGHRLLNMTSVFSLGITKGILTFTGKSTSLTTLDWVSGSLMAVMLYWVGLYEEEGPEKWQWFFRADLAPAIGYCTKCFIGELLWLLFFLDGLVFIFLLNNFLGNLTVLLLARFFPHFPHDAQWGVYIGFVVLAHILWYSVGRLTRQARTRVWAWQRVVQFVADYGPASRAEKCGRFRVVGTTVRLLCGVALVVLSFMIYYYLAWAPLCVRPVVLLRPCVKGQPNGSCFVNDDLDSRCTRGLVRLYSLYYYSIPRHGPFRIVTD
ncbi:hypothetical protein V8E53_005662 [Lactarius tabidus]